MPGQGARWHGLFWMDWTYRHWLHAEESAESSSEQSSGYEEIQVISNGGEFVSRFRGARCLPPLLTLVGVQSGPPSGGWSPNVHECGVGPNLKPRLNNPRLTQARHPHRAGNQEGDDHDGDEDKF